MFKCEIQISLLHSFFTQRIKQKMSKSTLKLAHSADAIPLANLSARSIASASRTHVPEVKLEDGDAITVAKEPSKLDGTNGNIYAASTYLSERTKRPQISEHSKQHGNSHKNISEIRLEALPVPVDLRDSNPRSSSVHTSSSRVHVNHKRNSLIQFLSLCYCLGMVGWNDGTTGPLLPTLQEYYKVCSRLHKSPGQFILMYSPVGRLYISVNDICWKLFRRDLSHVVFVPYCL